MALKYASTGKRVIGALVDAVVLLIVWLVFVFAFGERTGMKYSVNGWPAFFMFLIWLAYFIVLEAATGKTLGKMIAKTRVVDEKGKKISWVQSIARNLLRIIDAFFFYLIGFIILVSSKNKQRIGDMAAKTFVVQD